ncbi:hypothetical protein BHOIPH791_03510 [Bartonella henselae]|nr:hypothetical protein BhenCHDE101_04035 [Bartonella henselae]ETS08511.1 hypothetical protein Q655_00777 [Bartonella henselae JK 51]ETS09058.1 hypothetical protein Q654_00824 [Bartonella henselae JK 50]PNM38463.1 hypothetical protein AL470_003305 [Bartonella henselae str. Houston-1]OLL38946.1 hypothetical protein AT244_01250 [Bartonella henselae]
MRIIHCLKAYNIIYSHALFKVTTDFRISSYCGGRFLCNGKENSNKNSEKSFIIRMISFLYIKLSTLLKVVKENYSLIIQQDFVVNKIVVKKENAFV